MRPLAVTWSVGMWTTHMIEHPVLGWGDLRGGAFQVIGPWRPEGSSLSVIASVGDGWDHVSVTARGRCPTWDEMHAVKELFFHPHECAMQLHPPASDYVNIHPYCLHLWRPQLLAIPMPPRGMV